METVVDKNESLTTWYRNIEKLVRRAEKTKFGKPDGFVETAWI
jgi:hypothetical protein